MSARTFLSSAGLQACALVASIALTLHAQPQRPSFDVATIKRNVSLSANSSQRNMPGGRINFTNQRLRQVIRAAFGGSDIEVVGGPDWIDDDRWDIVAAPAVMDANAPWREMLKTLLMERFRLTAHVEQRERPIYAMVFARPDKQLGPNMFLTKTPCKIEGDCGSTDTSGNGPASGTIRGTARTMAQIARSLSGFAERRVLDRTGLPGRFDFELKWGDDVSIFTAVGEELGLKLQADRAQVDVVVVDSVERATED
jgi:uncharacterized protein (TIGR03435 family)